MSPLPPTEPPVSNYNFSDSSTSSPPPSLSLNPSTSLSSNLFPSELPNNNQTSDSTTPPSIDREPSNNNQINIAKQPLSPTKFLKNRFFNNLKNKSKTFKSALKAIDFGKNTYKIIKNISNFIPWLIKSVALIAKQAILLAKGLIALAGLIIKLILAGGWIPLVAIGGYFFFSWLFDELFNFFTSGDEVVVAHQAPVDGEIAAEVDANKCLEIKKTASPENFPDNNDGNKKTHFSFSISPKDDSKATLTGLCEDKVKVECNESVCPAPDPNNLTEQACDALKKALGVDNLAGAKVESAVNFDLKEAFPEGYPLPQGNNYMLENTFTLGFDCTNEEDESKNKSYTEDAIAIVIVGEYESDYCWPTSGIVTQKPYQQVWRHKPGQASHHDADAVDIGTGDNNRPAIYAPFTGNYTYKLGRGGSTGVRDCYATATNAKDGNSFSFNHMTSSTCEGKVGKTISLKKGQQIGNVNNTGNSSGNHLHLEVLNGGGTENNSKINELFNNGKKVEWDQPITESCSRFYTGGD